MSLSYANIYIFYFILIIIIKIKCMKIHATYEKNGNMRLLNIISNNFRRKTKLSLNILDKINKYKKENLFEDIVYANKKKSIINTFYKEIIKRDKKIIVRKLNEIINKQQRINPPLFFNESVHCFHKNFFYYYVFFYILGINTNTYIPKKIHKFFINKLKIELLNNAVCNLNLFKKIYIWNEEIISNIYKKYFKIYEKELYVIIDQHLNHDEYYQSRWKEYDNKEFTVPLLNTYAILLFNTFNKNFYIKSLHTIKRLIQTNIKIYILKNYINDLYSVKKILYTYKVFFKLSIKKNMIPLFCTLQDNLKLNKNFEYFFDEIIKQVDVDVPNLKIINLFNLFVILFKLLLNKITQLLFYSTLIYMQKKIHERKKFIKDIYSFPFY
ncbi:conserved Plasmodium protein, unknown function [Plasmodium gallinaceum]|uniref:Uncharacterized protein n=1 Tax=Plasmodium gallinaceum TaxID=5849 RepID=A0A1J1GSW3_PLAGA|nr:conserved Plasmodium protein, unknown function [Plasmodium gallinaceum]CRG95374.1 conserved Plasmodium protein, unknown function [Plasmodium gallinaceum]